jgi:hypothetical protein
MVFELLQLVTKTKSKEKKDNLSERRAGTKVRESPRPRLVGNRSASVFSLIQQASLRFL